MKTILPLILFAVGLTHAYCELPPSPKPVPTPPPEMAVITVPTPLPVMIGGKPSGSMVLPVGAKVKILTHKGPDQVVVQYATGASGLVSNSSLKVLPAPPATPVVSGSNPHPPVVSGPVMPHFGSKSGDETFMIEINKVKFPVHRFGNGPIGVIMFNNDGILNGVRTIMDDRVGQCIPMATGSFSVFLWEHPDCPPFNQRDALVKAYWAKMGEKRASMSEHRSAHLTAMPSVNCAGVAASIYQQIRAQSKLSKFLLIGHGFGASMIMWDMTRPEMRSNHYLLLRPGMECPPPVYPLRMYNGLILINDQDVDQQPYEGHLASWFKENKDYVQKDEHSYHELEPLITRALSAH